MVRPFPKSITATAERRGTKKVQCRILTKSPEKRLEAEAKKELSECKTQQRGESNRRPLKKFKKNLDLL